MMISRVNVDAAQQGDDSFAALGMLVEIPLIV